MLHYNPQTGVFTWLQAESIRVRAGTEAGATPSPRGYRRIQIDKVRYYAHVLAWFYMMGTWRPDEIDHKDRDGLNNRWNNLRLATRKQNNENKMQYRRKNPGVKGVYQSGSKWYASIMHNKTQHYLGTFETLAEAQVARRAAEKRYFTHAQS